MTVTGNYNIFSYYKYHNDLKHTVLNKSFNIPLKTAVIIQIYSTEQVLTFISMVKTAVIIKVY